MVNGDLSHRQQCSQQIVAVTKLYELKNRVFTRATLCLHDMLWPPDCVRLSIEV